MDQLTRIESKIDILLHGKNAPVVDLKEAMRLLGCGSISSFRRQARAFKITAMARGKYSRVDMENAVARKNHEAHVFNSQREADRMLEETTEGHVHRDPPNPHD